MTLKSFFKTRLLLGLACGAVGCTGSMDAQTDGSRSQEGMQSTKAGTRQVHVMNLSTLGGTVSSGNGINDLGIVTGSSNLAGDTASHAVLWFFGLRLDLHTLGGQSSNVPWPVKNVRGVISGISETTEPRPLGELWSCARGGFFASDSGNVCRGFIWEHGVMSTLPTFGGPNGFATGINNHDQAVGWAENTVHDPTCTAPQVFQFKAAVWDAGSRVIHELPTLPGDSVGAATAINDLGQIVGITGACGTAVGSVSARHAVMWHDGQVTDLGNLGGIAWNTPMSVNQRGDVVGFANVPRADGTVTTAFNAHGFIYTPESGMQEIKPLGDDVYSQALGINDQRQVVGLSCTAGFASCRAIFWENGVATDLNEVVTPGYRDHLYTANDINDLGLITGQTVRADSGDTVAFVAIPVGSGP